MASEATSRQLEVLRAIRELSQALGFPPTLHELSARMGMAAAGGAKSSVTALSKKGLLHVHPGKARGMTITDDGMAALAQSETTEERTCSI